MFKVIGGIIWVLGGLANIFLLTSGLGSVSFLAFLIGLAGTFLYGLVFWTIGVIFEEMESIRQLIYDMKKEITVSLTRGSNKTQTQSGATHMVPIANSVWACPSCGSVNTSSTITCKGCGQYR